MESDLNNVFARLIANASYQSNWPDIPGLRGLWTQQGGKCAITGLDMVTDIWPHECYVQVALINSKPVLVCSMIVPMLNVHGRDKTIKFLDRYFEERVRRDGYRHYTSSGEYIPESF